MKAKTRRIEKATAVRRTGLYLIVLLPGLCVADPFAYITNYLDNTVSVIDTATDTVVDKFKGLSGGTLGPWGVAINPRGNQIYVSQPYFRSALGGGDQLAVVKTRAPHRSKAVGVGRGAFGIAMDPLGTAVYQVNTDDGTISVIGQFGNHVSTLPVPLARPLGIATGIVKGERLLFVSEMTGNSVAVIDPVKRQLVGRIPVGRSPAGIVVSQDGTRAYVANYQDNSLSVIATDTRKVIRSVPVGYSPYGVAINPMGTRVYVANQPQGIGGKPVAGSVSVVNTVSLAETARVRVGKTPTGLAVSGDGRKVYVANTDSNTVSVIKARAKPPRVTQEIKVGRGPVAFGSFIGPAEHYYVVRTRGGKIASLQLIRRRDGKALLKAFPYGLTFAATSDQTRTMEAAQLKTFLSQAGTAERISTPSVVGAGPSYNTGLALGYAPSTGPTTGQCLNYTTQPPGAPQVQLNLSSQGAASSYAAQTNASATVSTSFLGFKASNTFSFSNQYSASANSGSVYFNGYAIYNLNSSVDEHHPLNAQGESALNSGGFSQLCGTQYMTTLPAGMLVSMETSWYSDSTQQSQAISDQFKSGYQGGFNISAAVNAAYGTQFSDATFGIDLTISVLGGGVAAMQTVTTAFQTALNSLQTCTSGAAAANQQACNTVATTLSSGLAQGLTTFQASVQPLPTDLSAFQAFPNGVAGVQAETNTAPIPSSSSDALEPYKTQLATYVTLLNQVATLANRAQYLNTAVGQNYYNPVNVFNLQGLFGELQTTYANDTAAMLENLGNCLQSTKRNATKQCAPIINNQVGTAYNWYATGGGNPNWLAQQNTVALQYTAITTFDNFPLADNGTYQWPSDVVYSATLPNSIPADYGQMAGLTTFADAPYNFWDGIGTFSAAVILPIQNNTDLSTISTSAQMVWLGLWDGDFWDPIASPMVWTQECAPTFANPCPFGYQVSQGSAAGSAVQLMQLPQFFTTD